MHIIIKERIHSQVTDDIVPQEATITTTDEFYEVPFIKDWYCREDFVNFYKYKSETFSNMHNKECWILYCKISIHAGVTYLGIGYLFGDAIELDIPIYLINK